MNYKKMDPRAQEPTRNNPDDAGLDLFALESFTIPKGEGRMIRTGIAMELPERTVGLICDRSGMGKKGLKVHGGVIDVPYRGEIQVVLWNHSGADYTHDMTKGIAQILVIPILFPVLKEVQELSDTARGAKGFGSSDKK